jgi:hypothetical protein
VRSIPVKKLLFFTSLLIAATTFSASSPAGTIIDNFDSTSFNKRLWGDQPFSTGPNQRCLQQNGVLKIQIDGVSQGEIFGAGLSSNFLLKGNFEIVLDYNLTKWPYSNGVAAGVQYMERDNFNKNGHMTRRSCGADEPPNPKENYVADFLDGTFIDHFQTLTDHNSGRMKLTRVGKIITGYFFNYQNSTWQKVGFHDYSATGLEELLVIGLNANSSTATRIPDGTLVHPFAGQDVEIAFDNLKITYDQIEYHYPAFVPPLLQLLEDQ